MFFSVATLLTVAVLQHFRFALDLKCTSPNCCNHLLGKQSTLSYLLCIISIPKQTKVTIQIPNLFCLEKVYVPVLLPCKVSSSQDSKSSSLNNQRMQYKPTPLTQHYQWLVTSDMYWRINNDSNVIFKIQTLSFINSNF